MSSGAHEADGQMNDPHVEELRCSVQVESGGIRVAEGAVMGGVELGSFRCEITEGRRLIAQTGAHYSTVDEARAVLEPRLRGWELQSDLKDKVRLRFAYEGAKIVDRNPTPGSAVSGVGHFVGPAGQLRAVGTVSRRTWPPVPPADLRESDKVRLMRVRWQASVDGKEGLLATVYYVLTSLEEAFGGGSRRPRKLAARALTVAFKCLIASASSRLWMTLSTAASQEGRLGH